MKCSELIEELQKLQKQHGDCQIQVGGWIYHNYLNGLYTTSVVYADPAIKLCVTDHQG